MSSRIVAFILREIQDLEVLEESLQQMGITWENIGQEIHLNNQIVLKKDSKGFRAEYNSRNVEANKFLKELSQVYVVNLEAKIERLRLEEAKAKESAILNQMNQEELKKKELELQRERRRLEFIKKQEESALKQQIDEKVSQMKKRAKELGYIIQEQLEGKERVLVLIRR